MILNSPIISGSLTVTGNIITSGSITISGSIASASYASNADLLDGLDATVFTLTSSFNAFTSSLNAFSASQNSFTASILAQTASLNSFSASVLTFTGSASTRLGALESYTSSLNAKTASFATTGSNIFIGTQTISGSVLQSGSFTSTGTLTAQTLVVQTITSSVVYSSGSNIFGNLLNNTQTFTGSVLVTGSLTISTGGNVSAPTIFGSTIACSPIGCFATSCATSFIGGTMSGTTIYGSTAVCSPVGKFTSCIDAGSGTFSGGVTATSFNLGNGQYLRLTRNSGTLQYDAFGIVVGTDNTRIISTNDFDIVNGGLVSQFKIAGSGVATFACQVNAESFYTNDTRYISNQIMSGYNANSEDSDIWINYTGYLGGTTRFRDFRIGNGKQGQIALFDGSTGAATFACQVCAPFLSAGNGTQSNEDDAPLTIKRGVGFAGLDFKSLRTTGNIGGIRFYDCAGIVQGQQLIEVDGSFNFYNATSNNRFKIAANGISCFACPTSISRAYNASYGSLQVGGIVDSFSDNAVFRAWNAAASFAGGSGTDAWAFSGNNTDYAVYGANDLYLYSGGIRRLQFTGGGVACFRCTVCAPSGVKFGSGATTLNYYEQGTWTPRLKNGSFTTNAGVSNVGWYTRMGNLITVGGTLDWGAGSGAQDGNSLQITCLPFASSNTSNERNVGQPGAPAAGSIGFKCTGKGQLVLVNDPGNVYIYLIETFQDGSYTTYIHNPLVANAGTLYGFQLTYHI